MLAAKCTLNVIGRLCSLEVLSCHEPKAGSLGVGCGAATEPIAVKLLHG